MSRNESKPFAELLTAAQMRAVERAVIDSGAVTGRELMERAGRGVVEAIFEEWPEFAKAPHRALVLCGPGNNGGDGFVIARLLHRQGWEVAVFLYGDAAKLPPDAQANYARWREMGEVRDAGDCAPEDAEGCDLVVDALFGTGLTRAFVPPPALGMIFHGLMSDGFWPEGEVLKPYVVAVDIPSGLDADSGRMIEGEGDLIGEAGAHLTVSFHRAKLGHVLADGPLHCGKLVVKGIGLDDRGNRAEGGPAVPSGEVARLAEPSCGRLPKHPDNHKYNHGHALILSGPMGRSGAARLAAWGALRIGAGLVTVAAPGAALMDCAAHLTAIMLRRCDGAEGLCALLEDPRLNALCLGPGLGVGEGTRRLVAAALKANRATVLDADALASFADDPKALFDLLHPHTVLTPHGGEFARLFPDIAAKLGARPTQGPACSKCDAARAAAERAGCVVLFKGSDTIIAAPDGRVVIHSAAYMRAAPWLATAGSGDVLAGFITGLLARGFDPVAAAETGAWLHVEAARSFGPGLIAEDLPEALPQVFRDLGI